MTAPASALPAYGIRRGEPAWFSTLRVVERHVGALAALLFAPLNGPLLGLALASCCIRLFAIEGINHRYFSHRAYKAGRAVQFVLALVAAQGGQRGSLWWASKHRDHHRHADTARDPHSPAAHPFVEAYATWFHKPDNAACNLDDIPDFARYPELRWLDRSYLLPFYGGALLCFLAGHYGWLGPDVDGVAALLWGFYFPSCFVLHATSMVNTFAHMPDFPGGYRRYDVGDRSVNRPLLALFTLGSGFHNNHHRHAAAARAGFAWYEIDMTYHLLWLLQAVGVIRELKGALPDEVLVEGGLKPRRRTP
jgi:stearoyl-CoA desaturase (delta-9 desaturase)